jgi:hypothetical protein
MQAEEKKAVVGVRADLDTMVIEDGVPRFAEG